MRANYVEYRSPQFRILSDKQIEEIYLGALQIMERTGVCFECQEALDILDVKKAAQISGSRFGYFKNQFVCVVFLVINGIC